MNDFTRAEARVFFKGADRVGLVIVAQGMQLFEQVDLFIGHQKIEQLGKPDNFRVLFRRESYDAFKTPLQRSAVGVEFSGERQNIHIGNRLFDFFNGVFNIFNIREEVFFDQAAEKVLQKHDFFRLRLSGFETGSEISRVAKGSIVRHKTQILMGIQQLVGLLPEEGIIACFGKLDENQLKTAFAENNGVGGEDRADDGYLRKFCQASVMILMV